MFRLYEIHEGMSAKKKKKNSVDGRGPSKVGLGTFVFFFELCWASLPIPFINHVGEVVGKW